MLIADWVALGVLLVFALIGFLAGFGRGLKFFTSGFFGFIISVIVCYYFGGLIYKIGFIADWLNAFKEMLIDKQTTFCDILVTIRIDLIVFYVILFIIVTIIRIIIVKIIKSIVEIDNVFLRFVNRTFGMVLFAAVSVFIMLAVFRIIYVIGGSTAANFYGYLSGSKLKLDWLFENNWLTKIIIFKIAV